MNRTPVPCHTEPGSATVSPAADHPSWTCRSLRRVRTCVRLPGRVWLSPP